MLVTLDSLVGQGPALTYCGLKGQNMRSSMKRQFLLSGKMFSYFIYLVLNQRIKLLFEPLKFWSILFQTANGCFIYLGVGRNL